MIRAVVKGCGAYLPERVLTNQDLESMVETNDAWIRERTGIKQRHIAAKGELTSDLAAKAGQVALSKARLQADELDIVILATATPDETFPGCATRVQHKLGASKAAAFDMQAACSGFVYGLSVADAMIRSNQAKHILLIGSETMSRVVDWTDRRTCILFGDGAGAVVLSAEEQPEQEPRGVLYTHIQSDGGHGDILKTTGGISSTQTAGVLMMEGQEVFRHAVTKMSASAQQTLKACGLGAKDVDWVIPHQANARILTSCAKKLQLPLEKLVMTMDQHANTSSASIPLALAHASEKSMIKEKNIVLMPALGAGLTWGTCIIRW